jgi:hypothetical protein
MTRAKVQGNRPPAGGFWHLAGAPRHLRQTTVSAPPLGSFLPMRRADLAVAAFQSALCPPSSAVASPMKLTADRPFTDPEKAARKLLEIANATETVQDWRMFIEAINTQFLFKEGGTPEEYKAGLACAIAKGWLWKHESGTYVKFAPVGAEMFA